MQRTMLFPPCLPIKKQHLVVFCVNKQVDSVCGRTDPLTCIVHTHVDKSGTSLFDFLKAIVSATGPTILKRVEFMVQRLTILTSCSMTQSYVITQYEIGLMPDPLLQHYPGAL